MTAISRSTIKIYIVDTGTAASSLADTDVIEGEIKTYSKSGGEEDVESDPVFGGFVNKEKPISQVEIGMEIIPRVDINQDRWDAMVYAVDTVTDGLYTMASDTSTQAGDKAIYIQATDGTGYKSWGFNNSKVTVFDFEHNADDNQTGNVTFKFSPTNESGVSNFMTAASAVTLLPDWTALDNN